MIKNKPLFCPICHKKIEIPKWLRSGNIECNNVNLKCGYCKKGQVTVDSEPDIWKEFPDEQGEVLREARMG